MAKKSEPNLFRDFLRVLLSLRPQKGASLILAIYVSFFACLLITVGVTILFSSKKALVGELRYQGQATNVARAGLIDALNWFRRRPDQAVTGFSPTELLGETDDQELGIVREFPIGLGGPVWARYEVSRDRAHPIPGVVATDNPRQEPVYGAVWHLESRGVVYSRHAPEKGFDELPNRVLREVYLGYEIQRLELNYPAAAALVVRDGKSIRIGPGARISAFNADHFAMEKGCYRWLDDGGTFEPSSVFCSQLSKVRNETISIDNLLGVSSPELARLSDVRISDWLRFDGELPSWRLIYVQGDLTATADQPLDATGVLVVDGNVRLEEGSGSLFAGLLYVSGDYYQAGPSQIIGTVIARGKIEIDGSAGSAEVSYDSEILDHVRQEISQYRTRRSPYNVRHTRGSR